MGSKIIPAGRREDMAAKTQGQLIKEARTAAGFTQEQLAKKVKGLTATDLNSAERNKLALTNDQVKAIAKATGVTQKSLLEASVPKTASAKTSGKTTAAKTAGKTTAKKPSGKTTGKTSSSKTASSGSTMKVTAAEKKLLQAYRDADESSRKAALAILKKGKEEEIGGMIGTLLSNSNVKEALAGLQLLK